MQPKYEPLYDYLTGLPGSQSDITLTFQQIEEILHDGLPRVGPLPSGVVVQRTTRSACPGDCVAGRRLEGRYARPDAEMGEVRTSPLVDDLSHRRGWVARRAPRYFASEE